MFIENCHFYFLQNQFFLRIIFFLIKFFNIVLWVKYTLWEGTWLLKYLKMCCDLSSTAFFFFLKGNNIAKAIGCHSLFWSQLKNKNRGDFFFAALFKSGLFFEKNMRLDVGKGEMLPGHSLIRRVKTTLAWTNWCNRRKCCGLVIQGSIISPRH